MSAQFGEGLLRFGDCLRQQRRGNLELWLVTHGADTTRGSSVGPVIGQVLSTSPTGKVRERIPAQFRQQPDGGPFHKLVFGLGVGHGRSRILSDMGVVLLP